MDFGQLYIRQEKAIDGRLESYSYRWEGGPYLYVDQAFTETMSYGQARFKKDRLIAGPFRLRLLASKLDEAEPFSVYKRDDRLWSIRVWFWKASKLLRILKSRIILSAAIWRLAWVPLNRLPRWHDVFLIQKFFPIPEGKA